MIASGIGNATAGSKPPSGRVGTVAQDRLHVRVWGARIIAGKDARMATSPRFPMLLLLSTFASLCFLLFCFLLLLLLLLFESLNLLLHPVRSCPIRVC